MFTKLFCIIIVCGFIAGALLVNRQRQIDLADRISDVHQHITEHERTLWRMERQIAERCRPQTLRIAMESSEQLFLPIENKLWESENESRLACGEILIENDGSGDF